MILTIDCTVLGLLQMFCGSCADRSLPIDGRRTTARVARVRKMMGLVVNVQYYLKVMRYSRQVSSCELALPTAPIPSRPDQAPFAPPRAA